MSFWRKIGKNSAEIKKDWINPVCGMIKAIMILKAMANLRGDRDEDRT